MSISTTASGSKSNNEGHARKTILNGIEKRIKDVRKKNLPIESLYSSYFKKRHPAFYTTIRSRLGPKVEQYLIAAGP